MSKNPTSRPDPMLFAEDSLVSHFPRREGSKPKMTPDISGQKCLDLSGNAGPLGSLEKMLLGSLDWAWTKYSLTWQTKATPQGRLIFQLARLAPRTSDSDSGLLHTPTAKANQTSPSMEERGQGNWVSSLWATPNTMDYLLARDAEDCSTNQKNREGRKRSGNLREQVVHPEMWPTPTTQEIEHPDAELTETGRRLTKDRQNSHSLNLADTVNASHPKSGGKLNPQWVAWLMGYPTEYLKSVHWETPSSRKSRKKSEKQ
jgi:hypothetical protein